MTIGSTFGDEIMSTFNDVSFEILAAKEGMIGKSDVTSSSLISI